MLAMWNSHDAVWRTVNQNLRTAARSGDRSGYAASVATAAEPFAAYQDRTVLPSRSDSGLRHLGVWESEAACQTFREDRVVPAVHTVLKAAGLTEMPPEPDCEELELVDVQVGSLKPGRQPAQVD
jgi:hypothetical protein